MIKYPGNYLAMTGKEVEYTVKYKNGFTRVSTGLLGGIYELDHRESSMLRPGDEAYILTFDDHGLFFEIFGDKGQHSEETLRVLT